ncbi:MAG: hypothetical protein AAGF59_05160, partial [Pseudomonadota bacterium]
HSGSTNATSVGFDKGTLFCDPWSLTVDFLMQGSEAGLVPLLKNVRSGSQKSVPLSKPTDDALVDPE